MNKIFTQLIAILLIFSLYNCKQKKENYQADQNLPVWIEMMEQPSVNMAEVRKSFDDYWINKEHFKGDRSKQFEQWYTINSKRLDQYGNVISAEQVRNEFQRVKLNSNIAQKGNWFNYGPINVGPRKDGQIRDGGRVKHIAFHPTDAKNYLVSTFKGGLFKTTDEGKSWTPLTDHLTQEVYISQYLPSNPNTIFIGTNLGILKSTDGGSVWNSTGLSSAKTKALILKSDNENILIAGNENGIYRSTNAGVSFTKVLTTSKVEEIKQHPTNPLIMYAGTNGSTSQFFKSVDGGLTWLENTTDFAKGAFMKIAVTKAAPNNVYVINSRDHLDQDSFDGVYVSTNSGTSFTKRSGTTPCITGYSRSGSLSRGQPNYNLFIVVDPINANIVYAGGTKSWKSTDGGYTWTHFYENVTPEGHRLHLDQLSWAYSPLNNRLFAVNDGGIYYLDANNKFDMITDGLPIAEVWECTQSQQNKSNVAGGTFHCGIKLNKNGKWYSPWGGDEATVLFDYSDDTYAYHFKYEKISRSVDGGMSFQRINPNSADRGSYTGTGVLDKSDVNTLYVGLFEVERINNARTATNSQVWDKISSFGGSSKIEKIEQSDANHNIMYVSRQDRKFYRSDNVRSASPTFTNLTIPVSGIVTDIATHPTNENIVYILLGSKIYKSVNKGSSWTDISSGLPNIALLEMIYDKSSDEGIYIGTDLGVYYKDNSLSSWIDYSKGLPAIRVSGMDIFYGATRQESILTVSTDGRGFWRSALNDVVISAPKSNFSSDETSVIQGNSINYIDTSTGEPLVWEWTFEGGLPKNSSLQNPTVTYINVGTYKTTLKTTNSVGTNTKEIVGYITVTENNGSGDLQLQYNFSNNLNDDSSYGRGLTTEGSYTPTFTNDKDNNSNKAYKAPSSATKYLTNAYTSIGQANERTVTAWIKTSTGGSRKTIISWGSNSPGKMFNVMVENGNVRVEGGSCNVQNDDSTVTRLDNNTWRHIAVTYNSANGDKMSDIKIYIDGVYYANQPDIGDSYNTETTVLDTDNSTNGIRIGAPNYTSSYYWVGDLDDIRVYSKELSVSEILDVMNASSLSLNNVKKEIDKYIAYPNKVDSLLTISSKESFSKSLNFKVYNINGKHIDLKHHKLENSKVQLNMSSLSSGVYFVNLIDGKTTSTFKIIKK